MAFDPNDLREGQDSERSPKAAKKPRGFLFFLVVLIISTTLLWAGRSFSTVGQSVEVSAAEFLKYGRDKEIAEIELSGYEAEATLLKVKHVALDNKEYTRIRTTFPIAYFEGSTAYNELMSFVEAKKFVYHYPNTFLVNVIFPLIPWVLIIFLGWWLFFRQMRSSGGPGNVLNFGRSRARFLNKDRKKVTFKDVAGVEEATEEVSEIVEFLRDPKKFQKLGGRIPRGVLLVGPPGTGKTLLAKAISGEANVPFLSISGSDFVELFVGVGASRVRDLFKQAKENSPCLIFLDEIDAVGRSRGWGMGGGHDEREQTLNAILVEMDGFETDESVIVIAATNRPDVLDPALLRPGRFDRQVVISLPDFKGREEILKIHAHKIKLAHEEDLKVIARSTPMLSGAHLEAIINEAALLAAMKNKEVVELSDLEEARDKVRWGRERRSHVMDEQDKKITAYHESGHTLIAELLPEVEPLHKVTIIPQGMALGATMVLPEKDRYHMQKNYCKGMLTMMFGGRSAEELFCSDISAGAQDDIKRATDLARKMVCEWGMSENVGPINYSETEEHLFLGRDISKTRNHSEHMAVEIDKEVRQLLDECYHRAKELIGANRDKLEKIAQALMKYESLSGDDVKRLLGGVSIDALRPASTTASEKPASAKPVPASQPEWRPTKGTDPLTGPAQA